ncbi:MAG: hypothetical protein WBL87_05550 [Methanothrix sp.]
MGPRLCSRGSNGVAARFSGEKRLRHSHPKITASVLPRPVGMSINSGSSSLRASLV